MDIVLKRLLHYLCGGYETWIIAHIASTPHASNFRWTNSEHTMEFHFDGGIYRRQTSQVWPMYAIWIMCSNFRAILRMRWLFAVCNDVRKAKVVPARMSCHILIRVCTDNSALHILLKTKEIIDSLQYSIQFKRIFCIHTLLSDGYHRVIEWTCVDSSNHSFAPYV